MNAESLAAAASVVAVLVSVAALRQGRNRGRAEDDRVDGANRIAAEALTTAQLAETRAVRAEQINLERSDVTWAVEFDDLHKTVMARNIGADTAHHVELIIDTVLDDAVEERRLSALLGQVGPTERIGVEVREVIVDGQLVRHALDLEEGVVLRRPFTAHVDCRVVWASALGRPGVHEVRRLLIG